MFNNLLYISPSLDSDTNPYHFSLYRFNLTRRGKSSGHITHKQGTPTPSQVALDKHRYPNDFIVILSSHKLTAAQIQLLSKGLNFCPTPGRPELSKTQGDFDRLHHSMRLRHFFHSPLEASQPPTNPTGSFQTPWQNRDESFDNSQFHNSSKFNPKGPGALKAFICCNDTHNSLNRQCKGPKDNLTPDERNALKELKSLSDSVIIKPADKGSAVVLMDQSDYLQEGLRQLSDLHFDCPVQEDLSAEHMLSIRDIVLNMRAYKEISKKVKDFLLDFPMRTSRFYLLPKIHKGKFPPPGRPIISGNGCPTERISQFVDFFLKEVAPKGTSFLKDTTHFLQSLHAIGKTPPQALFWSLWM